MTINQNVINSLPFSVTELTFLHKGENENFFIKTSTNESYILKRYREERKQRLEIGVEIELCHYLRKNSIEVPEYIPFRDGNFVYNEENRKYTIQKAISGFMIWNPDEEHMREIGKTYRKLHRLTIPSSLKTNLPRINESTLNEVWPHLINSKNTKPIHIEQFEHYKQETLENLNFTSDHLVHFDLHDGNIIYSPRGLCMLDWEECGLGNGIFDLAVTNTRLLKLDHSVPLRKALLDGYGEVELTQLKYATIFKLLYLAAFVAKFEDVLQGGQTLENLLDRYLGYFKQLGK